MKSENSPKTNGDKSADASKKNTGPFFKAGSRNTALPENLQQNLETSFQQDFSSVRIQKNSLQAKDMNALAFTQGEQIHFAPGQFNTNTQAGKNLIGHEFTHIVQQRSGAVKPTGIMRKGIMVNEEKGLEQEADVMGQKAVAGENISGYRSAGLGMRSAFSPAQPQMAVAQMAKQTSHYGDWFDDTYALKSSGGLQGVDMVLRFKPNANVNAELIGLTQTHQALQKGTPFFLNNDNFYKGHAITGTDSITNPRLGISDEGTHIDRVKDYNNPIYPVNSLPSTSLDDTSTSASWGQHGYRYTDPTTRRTKQKDAKLLDTPMVRANSTQVFETTAIATKGAQQGTYYGSVQWGWQTDTAGTRSLIPFRVVSEGVPSSTFMKAAGIWNAGQSSTGANTIDLPLVDVQLISNPAGVSIGLGPIFTHLPLGTRVRVLPTFVSMIESMIEVVDGPFIGETGRVNNSDLRDERP